MHFVARFSLSTKNNGAPSRLRLNAKPTVHIYLTLFKGKRKGTAITSRIS
jgi:hypothetical protein